MASEWVELFDTEEETSVHINLANASAIYPWKGGSEIWFLEHPGEEKKGRIRVKEGPDLILHKLREISNA